MYVPVEDFFRSVILDKKANLTSITLIPKVSNADQVKLFRPLSCCNIMYKIISKVLTNMLRHVIKDVVNLARAGFIPGRHFSDNILLATEIVKGYGRKYMSPTYMIKVDMRKTYEYVEWSFLESMM